MSGSRVRSPLGVQRAGQLLALLVAVLAVGDVILGEEPSTPDYTEFERLGRMGIRELDGEVIVPPRYDFAAPPAEGFICVEEGAAVVRPVPFLRFQTGYRMAGEDQFLEVEDVDLAIDYLERRKGEGQ